MIDITVNTAEIEKLKQTLEGGAKKLRQQLYIATNKTAAKVRKMIAKSISADHAAPQKVIRKTIWLQQAKVGQKSKATITAKNFEGIPLRLLKAKQDKKGVTFRGRKSEGRTRIEGAFMGPRPGAVSRRWKGSAYKRNGKQRSPIESVLAPSTYEVFVALGVEGRAVTFAKEQLIKEINERTRFLGLKKSGAI